MSRVVCVFAAVVASLPLSVAAAGGADFHSVVAADDPILWYRFSETKGTTITNFGSLGAAFDGTLVNGVTLGASSVVGDGAAGFDNTLQQYVESASAVPTSLTGNPTFTAEAIVRVEFNYNGSGFGYPPLLHWGGPFTGQSVYFSLWRFSGSRYYAGFYNGGLRTVDIFPQGCFLHVVWVRDSNGGTAGQWAGSTMYINGKPVALEADTTLPGAPTINVTSTTFRVQKATDGVRYFPGSVDEVILYDRPLTAEEVAEHFATLSLPTIGCQADFDGNGEVDGGDLGQLLGAWNTSGSPGDCSLPGAVDLNCDCIVNAADLGILLGQWGTCP